MISSIKPFVSANLAQPSRTLSLQTSQPDTPRFAGGLTPADTDAMIKRAKKWAIRILLGTAVLGAGVGVLVTKGCQSSNPTSPAAPTLTK